MRAYLRMALVLPALCLALPAEARPHQRNFWEWVLDPTGAEIRVVLARAENNLQSARNQGEDDPVAQAMLEDARGMLRFGLRLEPRHPRLLLIMGAVCDELGRIDESVAALERYLEVELPDRIQADARYRLGRAYARRGEHRAAIAQLLHGAARSEPAATLALAEVYQELGRMDDAIDTLETYMSRRGQFAFGGDEVLQLALAIAYDRDEQMTRAREVMDKLLTQRQQRIIDLLARPYGPQPPELYAAADRHYAQAYVYEIAGFRQDARAEWTHYAASGGRHRARALAHVRALDAGEPPIVSAPPPIRPIHPPRPPLRHPPRPHRTP